MRVGIIQFPGSNCDMDLYHVLHNFFDIKANLLWHDNFFQEKYELIILPGGFSYGNYLRAGAIARFAKAMKSLETHIKRGACVLGICNGFQILCEASLLPGTLLANQSLKHVARDIRLTTNSQNRFTKHLSKETMYQIPVSHSEGNYYIEENNYKKLLDNNQIAFQYQATENPNGSFQNIAGVSSPDMKILGMMPHPERAINSLTGGTDGKLVLQSILNAI